MVHHERMLGEAETASKVNLSPSTIDRRIKDGSFPAPVRISARRKAWAESQIDQWIADRLAGTAA